MMKQISIHLFMMCISAMLCASEEDLFKRLEKEVSAVELDFNGIQRYQSFMQQMQTIEPQDNGVRELGYTVQRTKRKKVRYFDEQGIEHLCIENETFDLFKGFRVTDQGAVSISCDLDMEQFDQNNPAVLFFCCMIEKFSQKVGRVQISQEDDTIVKFWQPRSKRVILGCRCDTNGLPKSLK